VEHYVFSFLQKESIQTIVKGSITLEVQSWKQAKEGGYGIS